MCACVCVCANLGSNTEHPYTDELQTLAPLYTESLQMLCFFKNINGALNSFFLTVTTSLIAFLRRRNKNKIKD